MAAANQQAVINLVLNGRQAETNLKDITKTVVSLRRELFKMNEADNPALYKQKSAELQKMLETQQKMRREIEGTATGWQKIVANAKSVTMGVLGGNLITGTLNQIQSAVPKIMAVNDSMADVMKTTDMSEAEVRALNEQLGQINTRTLVKDLRELAAAGGSFDIPKDQIDEFAESADKLHVAIGDQFGGDARETATVMMKLRNTFLDIKSVQADQDMLHIGNALNFLEAKGSATGSTMADMGSRIGGVAIPMGFSSAQTLGLAAALEEMNVTAERGGTAVTNLLMAITKDTTSFAKLAGMSVKDFTHLVNTDLYGAFMKVAQGMSKGDNTATGFAQKLADMGLNGTGVQEVLMKVASNQDLVNQRVTQAGDALTKTDSITDEFNKKNFQLAQDLQKLDTMFENIYTSPAVQNFVGTAVSGVVRLLQFLPEAVRWTKEHTTAVMAFIYAMVMLNRELLLQQVRIIANTTAVIANKVAYEVGFRWLVLHTTAQRAYGMAVSVATGQITLATAATRIWNAVLAANPIGLVVTALTALVGAIKIYSDNSEKVRKLDNDTKKLKGDLAKVLTEQEKVQKGINDKIAQFNTLSPVEQANVEKMTRVQLEHTKVLLAQNKAKQQALALQAADPTVWQQFMGLLQSGGSGSAFSMSMGQYAADNMQATAQQFDADIQQLEQQVQQYENSLNQIHAMQSAPTPGGSGGGGGQATTGGKKKKAKKDEFAEALQKARYDTMTDNRSDYEKDAMAYAEKFTELFAAAGNDPAKYAQVEQVAKAAWTIVEDKEKKRQADLAAKEKEKADNKAVSDGEAKLHEEFAIKSRAVDTQQATEQISPEQAQQQKLKLKETELMGMLALYQAYGKDITEVQSQLTENWSEQENLRAEVTYQNSQRMKEAEMMLHQARREAFVAGIEAVKSFVGQNTIAYKALFIAQKGFAVAEALINLRSEISAISKNPTYNAMPDGGLAMKSIMIGVATTKAFTNIAQIKKTAIEGMAGRETGGYTGVNDLYVDKGGNPEGFVTQPTLFALGQRSYIAGEGHKKEYVISYPMLQNPAIANFVSMLEAGRKGRMFAEGGFTGLTPGMASGQTILPGTSSPVDISAMVNEIRALRREVSNQQGKPVVLNYRVWEEYDDRLAQIKREVSL